MFIEERQDPVIDEIGSGDGGFFGVEFTHRHTRIGVDKGLLVNPPHALHGADIIGILGTQIARIPIMSAPVPVTQAWAFAGAISMVLKAIRQAKNIASGCTVGNLEACALNAWIKWQWFCGLENRKRGIYAPRLVKTGFNWLQMNSGDHRLGLRERNHSGFVNI